MSDIELTMNVPARIKDLVIASNIYMNYTSSGNISSYGIDLLFKELNLRKSIKSKDLNVLQNKIEDTFFAWDNKYESHLKKTHHANKADEVNELNALAVKQLEELNGILAHTLDIDDTIDWDLLERKDVFKLSDEELDSEHANFIKRDKQGKPLSFEKLEVWPIKPEFEKVKSEFGLLSKMFGAKKIEEEYKKRVDDYTQEVQEINDKNQAREDVFNTLSSRYERKREQFYQEQSDDNDTLMSFKQRYTAKEKDAIEEYCALVLENSQYPDYFPSESDLSYVPESGIVIIDFTLPAPDTIPSAESFSYVKTRNELKEKHRTEAAQKKLYDSVIYQICIRTIHEIFEADAAEVIEAVSFNGIVTNINPATGKETTRTIISILAKKAEFMEFDLSRVDPKATFKHLKGVSAASLVDLAPVPPVMQLDRTDKRIVEGVNLLHNIDDSVNLAAIHWEEFEHLVREVFEKEFVGSGGEVKVTQASSDGGVDAIAFDPDPIRGGKIVIQAKRYTNTVGVSAVRDLYGTVMNEGATKGILVTTSTFGADSYEFAKGKPLSLINGSNLLALLEKHGHTARINLAEAKKLLNTN